MVRSNASHLMMKNDIDTQLKDVGFVDDLVLLVFDAPEDEDSIRAEHREREETSAAWTLADGLDLAPNEVLQVQGVHLCRVLLHIRTLPTEHDQIALEDDSSVPLPPRWDIAFGLLERALRSRDLGHTRLGEFDL
jgi:hypothetical protein